MEEIKQKENLELFPAKIRFSVINVLRTCHIKETGESFFIAILGKPIKIDGIDRPRYQGLGGAAKISPELKIKLEKKYGASFNISGRPAEENDDARFIVDIPENLRELDDVSKAMRDGLISEIQSLFNKENSESYELDITRELREDLVSSGLLSEDDFTMIEENYSTTVSPIMWNKTTSERMSREVPSYRIFHLHDIILPESIFNKIKNNPKIRVLSKSDISSIKEATQNGNPAAEMEDGVVIVENVFL